MNSRTTLILSAILLIFSFVACSPSEEAPSELPPGTSLISLREFGKPFSIPVPDTSQVKLTMMETSDGALTITAGRNFALTILEEPADLDLRKEDLNADEVNRLARIVREDSTGLVWESAITEPEFHFVLNRSVAGARYSFMDAPGFVFSEQDVQRMFECSSLAK